MTPQQKQQIVDTIITRERLRPLNRLSRLIADPLRAFPYYILALASHIKPYKISFKSLWGEQMTGFLPEANTFYYYGYCEANLTNYLIKNLPPDAVFIDVGAHIGFYSMLVSKLVGEHGQVHSFEPTPRTFALLKQNTQQEKNVTISNYGISDTLGTLDFLDYGPGYGAFNTTDILGAPAIHRKAEKVSVPMLTIDTYCKNKKIIPTFVKIDAEGADYRVLKGMASCLKNNRPLISLEVVGDEQWIENRRNAFDELFKNGYLPYEINTNGTIFPHKIKEAYSYDNLLFIPKESKLLNLK